jgi:hypothetical protein
MKSNPTILRLRPLLILAAIVTLAPAAAANTTPADGAAQNLQRHGRIPVAQAGPFVAPGTFRVQVAAKLGRPDITLPDGTWLFHQRRVEGSDAQGTLVVAFESGRVSSLALVTREVAVALHRDAQQRSRGGVVATK